MLHRCAAISRLLYRVPSLHACFNIHSPIASFATSHLQILVEPLSDQNEGISLLSLNRPESRNALGRQLIREIEEALNHLRQERSTRCVIVRSAIPGVFCAGADLKERAGMTTQEAAAFVSTLRQTFTSLEELPMPTIGLIEGPAVGGGAELALAADIRLAGPAALFAFPETRLGIIPGAGGTQRLPRLIGPSRAKLLVFTGRRVGPAEALALGLVDEVVLQPAEGGGEAGVQPGGPAAATTGAGAGAKPVRSEVYERALAMAREIAKGAPLALRQAKAAISMGTEVDQGTGMRIEGACYAQLLHTSDRLEGLRAFAEKRPPQYTGQ